MRCYRAMMLRRAISLLILMFVPGGLPAEAPRDARLRDGAVFRDCTHCAAMVVIPGGRFTMGSPADEAGRDPAEGPQHEVALHRFALGATDVTVGEWRAFVRATRRSEAHGCEWSGFPKNQWATASWRHLGFAQADTHPVVCVSWQDARDYAAWMSKRTRHPYRLPSEAEWEYAARAGATTAYPWGDTASHEYANYGADTCCSERGEGHDRWLQTSPVGSFPANRFGLYDMIGNAWQWVADCYVESYVGAPTDGSAVDQPGCTRRVLRGGTWGDPPDLIRAAFRNWAPPPHWPAGRDYRSGGVGFRLARSLDG
ncbi:formylglycine-generating enzyme family protein [soil metagenome]